jgi:hypothetical protein
MKNHHDRVSQRDSKQRDKTDHRAHRQGAAKKNKNCAPTNQLALPVLLFTLELNQKDHKLCAAATVEQHLKRVVGPYPADQMRMWEISPLVNSPKNDDPDLITPFELSSVS